MQQEKGTRHPRSCSRQHCCRCVHTGPCLACCVGHVFGLLLQKANRKLDSSVPNQQTQTSGTTPYAGLTATYNCGAICAQGNSCTFAACSAASCSPFDVNSDSNPESACASVAVGNRGGRGLQHTYVGCLPVKIVPTNQDVTCRLNTADSAYHQLCGHVLEGSRLSPTLSDDSCRLCCCCCILNSHRPQEEWCLLHFRGHWWRCE